MTHAVPGGLQRRQPSTITHSTNPDGLQRRALYALRQPSSDDQPSSSASSESGMSKFA